MYSGIASLLSPRPWLLTLASPQSIVSVSGTTNLLFPHTHWPAALTKTNRENKNVKYNIYTVDYRYLEFDGTMEKIRVNRSSTQEELWKYQKCSLFNDERETTRAKFWRAKTSIACLDSRNDLKVIRCFCCCFFSLLNSLNLVEWLITARHLFFVCVWLCLSVVLHWFNKE